MKTYIVTEGKTDALLLERVLFEYGVDVRIMPASGASAASSLATSLLMEQRGPVILVLDADTADIIGAREIKEETEALLRSQPMQIPSKVTVAVPSLEIVFFLRPDILRKIVKRDVTDELVQIGRFSPRETLRQLFGEGDFSLKFEEAIGELSDEEARALQGVGPILEVATFLRNLGVSKRNAA